MLTDWDAARRARGWPRAAHLLAFARTGEISAETLAELVREGQAARGSVVEDARELYRYLYAAGPRGPVEGWPNRPG